MLKVNGTPIGKFCSADPFTSSIANAIQNVFCLAKTCDTLNKTVLLCKMLGLAIQNMGPNKTCT